MGGPEGPISIPNMKQSGLLWEARKGRCCVGDPEGPTKRRGIRRQRIRKNPIESEFERADTVGVNERSTNDGYRRLRKGRRSIPQQTYLITTVCIERQPLFADVRRASAATETLREPRLWRDSKAQCWVLMPDHLHLVLTLGESESLMHAMNRIKSVTSRAAREAVSGVHPIWMPGFHDRALRREEDVPATVRYVLENPVRAGLVSSAALYPHSECGWAGVF